MSETPLADAVGAIGTGPDGLELDVARTDAGAVSGTVSASTTLGKGWRVSAGVAYAQKAWAAVGKVVWTPRTK